MKCRNLNMNQPQKHTKWKIQIKGHMNLYEMFLLISQTQKFIISACLKLDCNRRKLVIIINTNGLKIVWEEKHQKPMYCYDYTTAVI